MQSKSTISRRTVDQSGFPDLVVIYLGMKVRSLGGLRTVLHFGPRISRAIADKPPGMLLHESLLFSIYPLHPAEGAMFSARQRAHRNPLDKEKSSNDA